MIGLSQEGNPSSYELFNTNTINILKNAAAYLLNPYTYYDYATNQVISNVSQNTVIGNIKYFNKTVNNPNQENLTIFNAIGIPVLTSKDSYINVQQLPSGLYIVKAKTETLKFIK
jgi:hypothetical protein